MSLELVAQNLMKTRLDLARRFTPSAVPQPPRIERPQEPWSYGVLGPELE